MRDILLRVKKQFSDLLHVIAVLYQELLHPLMGSDNNLVGFSIKCSPAEQSYPSLPPSSPP